MKFSAIKKLPPQAMLEDESYTPRSHLNLLILHSTNLFEYDKMFIL